jgi:hypothetical protein
VVSPSETLTAAADLIRDLAAKACCKIGWHRWRRLRLFNHITLLGASPVGPDAQLSFKVDAADYVDECARCARQRPVDTP